MYGVDWLKRGSLKCGCGRYSSAPAQCSAARCLEPIHGSCALKGGLYQGGLRQGIPARALHTNGTSILLCKKHTLHAMDEQILRYFTKKTTAKEASSGISDAAGRTEAFARLVRPKLALRLVWTLGGNGAWPVPPPGEIDEALAVNCTPLPPTTTTTHYVPTTHHRLPFARSLTNGWRRRQRRLRTFAGRARTQRGLWQ